MTDSIGLFYSALSKIEEAREELDRGATVPDREAAKVIFDEMCASNLQHMGRVDTIRQLALASLLYAQAVLRQDMSAQATSKA
jgi:hypothetical protein